MKTIVVTGYKPMELGIFKNDDPKVEIIKTAIKKRLIALIDEGLHWVLISGQMGVELWTGEIILELKEEYDIKLAVLPPFSNQQSRWPDAMQHTYEFIIEQCDFYKEIYEKEYDGPYQFRARDQFFVEHSEGCIMLYDEETPGSPQYFLKLIKKYKEHHTYELLFITPLDLDETVEEIRLTNPDYWTQ
ncbi:SLOG family protein [Halobacillus sp. B23F22_1]|uniref:SLOG family protein n=1 Tax=Halobacillus sp. B23F22_1 TaxID=3459514 RepID=UPI00373F85D1